MPKREITLVLDEALERRVEAIRNREGSPSIAILCGHALAVYEYLLGELDAGVKVVELAALMEKVKKLPSNWQT